MKLTTAFVLIEYLICWIFFLPRNEGCQQSSSYKNMYYIYIIFVCDVDVDQIESPPLLLLTWIISLLYNPAILIDLYSCISSDPSGQLRDTSSSSSLDLRDTNGGGADVRICFSSQMFLSKLLSSLFTECSGRFRSPVIFSCLSHHMCYHYTSTTSSSSTPTTPSSSFPSFWLS